MARGGSDTNLASHVGNGPIRVLKVDEVSISPETVSAVILSRF